MTKPLRSPALTLAASAVTLAGLTAPAFSHLGFLGVAPVGLVLMVMAARSGLQYRTTKMLTHLRRVAPHERRRAFALASSRDFRLLV